MEDSILNPNIESSTDYSSITDVLNGLNPKKKKNALIDPLATDTDRWLAENSVGDIINPMDSVKQYSSLANVIAGINQGKMDTLAKQKELEDKDLALIKAQDELMNQDPDVARANSEGRQLTPEERERVSSRAESRHTPKVQNFWKEAVAEPISKVFGF